MKASCYLKLRPKYNYWKEITGFTVVQSNKNKPSLQSGEVAIKVTIDAPPELFDPQEVGVVVNVKQAMIGAEQEGL